MSRQDRKSTSGAKEVNERALDFRRELDENTRTVVGSFGALVRYAKVTSPQNATQADFQINIATARLATASERLLRQIREVKLAVMLQDAHQRLRNFSGEGQRQLFPRGDSPNRGAARNAVGRSTPFSADASVVCTSRSATSGRVPQDKEAMDREVDQVLEKISAERAELEKELEVLSNELKTAYAKTGMRVPEPRTNTEAVGKGVRGKPQSDVAGSSQDLGLDLLDPLQMPFPGRIS